MTKVQIGIIKEGKIPIDRRVPLTPTQCSEILSNFPEVAIKCQTSNIRCFPDEEYRNAGVEVVEDISDCEIILGVKEVPIPTLMEGKTHFFFSHTIKKQEYNRELLREILRKRIRLIDWECLTNKEGQRLIAFGRYAGIVGAYNAIWTFGKRYRLFELRRAHECFDLADMQTEYSKVKLPAIKIALTGGGRVSKGAMEVLMGMGIRRVSPAEFINEHFEGPVFTQLNTRDYNKRSDGEPFDRDEFYSDPSSYESDFHQYANRADILIAGAFWDPHAPVLFTKEDILGVDFKIRVIGDITCDIEGSIPSTKQPSTIDDPIYDYNPSNDKVEAAMSDEGNITVMAVDNLPCELPRNASEDFGKEFITHILPNLIGEDVDGIIDRATITQEGALTSHYSYLQDLWMDINRYIEHTNLKPSITAQDVDSLVKEAMEHNFVGVCLPPFWVKKAARDLKDTDIQLVTVIGFPLGYQMTETKIAEIEKAIETGANELDIVMNVSSFKTGLPWTKIELAKCASIIHEAGCLMKVILETAYLSDEEIVNATKLCADAGTDFVKTSTGFASEGAKVEHVRLMRQTAPSNVGVKASGGIKDLTTANQMIEAGADRIGTSSGVGIMKQWHEAS